MSEIYKRGDRLLAVVTLISDGVDSDGEIATDVGYVPVENIAGRVRARYVLFDEAE